jgi:crossover junction endodeoxyribonuclease RuvC
MEIGIDIGLSGAIAFLKGTEFINVYDMPVMVNGKHNQVNAAELAKILKCVDISIAYVERESAMPGQGVSGMFSFGMSYGIVQGVLAALGISMVLVSPVAWKKAAGLLHKDKDMARTVCQRIYPSAPLGRKKDIGRADAILIGRFGGNLK